MTTNDASVVEVAAGQPPVVVSGGRYPLSLLIVRAVLWLSLVCGAAPLSGDLVLCTPTF